MADATAQLRAAGVESPEVNARRLGEEASGQSGAAFRSRMHEPAGRCAGGCFDAMVARRLAGEPLQYVLGRWGFRTLDLLIDRRVLIPRPETEQVVEEALRELDRSSARESTSNDHGRQPKVIDLGCGSGAIGLSIAEERSDANVWCADASAAAVAVTRMNLAAIGPAAARVTVVEGSWFEPLPPELRGAIDLIVTNPPYVATGDRLPADVVDWEPTEALVAGPTGLESIEHILLAAPTWLAPGGALVIEIGDLQGAAARQAARRCGFSAVEVRPDLAGRDRTLIARRF